LLAIGIKNFSGNFNVGSVLSVIYKKCEIAKGLTNYSKNDLEKIKGLKSMEFHKVLGRTSFKEVIHKDNLAIMVE